MHKQSLYWSVSGSRCEGTIFGFPVEDIFVIKNLSAILFYCEIWNLLRGMNVIACKYSVGRKVIGKKSDKYIGGGGD